VRLQLSSVLISCVSPSTVESLALISGHPSGIIVATVGKYPESCHYFPQTWYVDQMLDTPSSKLTKSRINPWLLRYSSFTLLYSSLTPHRKSPNISPAIGYPHDRKLPNSSGNPHMGKLEA